MMIPTEWLREYVDYDLPHDELAEALIRAGIGIEAVHESPPGLGGVVLEAEITPNRGDCLSMVGIAREVAAIVGGTARRPEIVLEESADERIEGRCSVTIDEPDLCPRYSARLVLGAQHGPSPGWMQRRLIACGQRPIDVFVDVTNLVLFELGQPLHAFDYDRLGPRIGVRRAREGEMFVTLDEAKRTLTREQLLITDGERGVALAGVMGGLDTAVTERTRNILLEGAHFHGPNIRRTARLLGLESESSYRFARTVDPALTTVALDRCAQLLAECAGATVAAGTIDVIAKPIAPLLVTLRPERCNQILGTRLAAAEMARYLESLELVVEPDDGVLLVTVPTFRPDLTREVDLIEEIARRHGYDRIATTAPPPALRVGRPPAAMRIERRLRELLCGAGLNEVQTFSLTSPEAMARAGLGHDPGQVGAAVLQNALNQEYSLLRWSLLPSLLEVLGRNEAAHSDPVRIFEIGRVYTELDRAVTDEQARAAGRVALGRTATTLPEPCREQRTLGLAVTGARWTAQWNLPAGEETPDFYEVKGIFEAILDELGVDGLAVEATDQPPYRPGRAACFVAGDRAIATLGEVDPTVLERYEIRRQVVALEADLGWLLEQAGPRRRFRSLPRFPAALRDLALVVGDAVPQAAVADAVRESAGELLVRLELFDVYRGQGLPEGARSLAYRLTFRHAERTLTDAEVDGRVAAVVTALSDCCGARLRE